MTAQARRAWHSIVLPADLHAEVQARCGYRQLTTALADALAEVIQAPQPPAEGRPARYEGTVEITLRLPVELSDAADAWRTQHGLSRQATAEYAALAVVRGRPPVALFGVNSAGLESAGNRREGRSHDHTR